MRPRKTDPSNPDGMPWQRWLPHAVVFVRDHQGRVCALRTVEDGAPVELALGAVIVRTAPGVPGPGLVEWSVHASVSRHSREAKAALAIIQYTQLAMQAWQKRLETEREGAGAPAPRKAPVPSKDAGPLRVRGRRVPAGRPAVARGACQALPPGDSRAASVHARPPRPAQPARPGALSAPHTRRSSTDSTAPCTRTRCDQTTRPSPCNPTTPFAPSPL